MAKMMGKMAERIEEAYDARGCEDRRRESTRCQRAGLPLAARACRESWPEPLHCRAHREDWCYRCSPTHHPPVSGSALCRSRVLSTGGVTMPNTNGHAPKRAILYARVSTEEQARSGYSLAQQLEALRECAIREGYEVLEEVQDPGQSGASLERPGMDRVRDLVATGGVPVVLAQDRDRFAREPAYHYLLKREFAEYGTKLKALNDRGDDSPEGQLTDDVLDVLAKFERAKTAERTRRGKLRKAREGKILAGRRVTYGFKLSEERDAYIVDEKK